MTPFLQYRPEKKQIKEIDWLTYKKSGVDTSKEDMAVDGLIELAKTTFSFRKNIGKPMIDIGHFAAIVNIGMNNSLVIKTDGVGTKIFIAQMMEKYDTIGIDCVAMNVNDIICVGAEPLSLLDYIAVQDPDPYMIREIGKGLVKGCELANISLVGGETAVMPEMIQGKVNGKGFDLVGMGIGIVPNDRIITGDKIEEGDAILGLTSTGIHSNSMTLTRDIFLNKARYSIYDYIDELERPLGEELLEPTRIYVKEVLEMISTGLNIKAIAHITSDGFLNLRRVSNGYGFIIDNLPEIPPIFKLIEKLGPVKPAEMYEVYNMGIGLCIVLPENEVEDAIQITEKYNVDSYKIGNTIKDPIKEVILTQSRLKGTDKFYPY